MLTILLLKGVEDLLLLLTTAHELTVRNNTTVLSTVFSRGDEVDVLSRFGRRGVRRA